MRTLLKSAMTFCAITCLCFPLMSAHIIGGQMSYELIGYDPDSTKVTYGFEFTLYRDALGGGASFDESASFGVYIEDVLYTWVPFHVIDGINHTEVTTISSGADDCLSGIGEVEIEKTTYSFSVELPISDKAYMIAYQRCCRSASINNLVNPGETGAAYSITITADALKLGNSSPQTTLEPVFFACAGEPFVSDNTSTDANGDSLVYKFCAPLASGGLLDANGTSGMQGCCECVRPDPDRCVPPFDEVVFADGYSVDMPFGENSSITLDPATGIISGTAGISGIYSYTICVEEYRNGVLIGRSNREVSSMSMLQATGTNDISFEQIHLFPNPVKDILRISSLTDIHSVDVISLQGEVLYNNIVMKENSLDVSALENGVYILSMKDANGLNHTHKFAKIQ